MLRNQHDGIASPSASNVFPHIALVLACDQISVYGNDLCNMTKLKHVCKVCSRDL